jgi:GTP pyrophosphokinase
MTPDQITARIGVDAWDERARARGELAVRLASTVFDGIVRDQGTPYIEHPVAVAVIARDEAGVTDPDTLIVALLHDALEIDRNAEAGIRRELGDTCADALRALTPDHRLDGRRRQPGDDNAYHRKIAALPDDLALVKLGDRLHNLRDLGASTNPERGVRFLVQLKDFYLPLATERGTTHPGIAALAAALTDTYSAADKRIEEVRQR